MDKLNAVLDNLDIHTKIKNEYIIKEILQAVIDDLNDKVKAIPLKVPWAKSPTVFARKDAYQEQIKELQAAMGRLS